MNLAYNYKFGMNFAEVITTVSYMKGIECLLVMEKKKGGPALQDYRFTFYFSLLDLSILRNFAGSYAGSLSPQASHYRRITL